MALPESDQLAVARRIGGNRQVFEHGARGRHSRRRVAVLVSVDADDDVGTVMQSSIGVAPWLRSMGCRCRSERRCGRTVMSHA